MAILSNPVAAAVDLKPHPLFGQSTLVESAELSSFWTTNTDAALGLRLFDWDTNPDALDLTGAETLPGGFDLENRYRQQLDLARGDFDGDGVEDIIAAYGHPLSSVYDQEVRLMLSRVDRANLDWEMVSWMSWGTMAIAPSERISPSNIRIRAGNFDRTAGCDTLDSVECRKEEFVLGTRLAGGGLRIETIELDDLGFPVSLASAIVDTLDDDMVRSGRFDIATSDFDNDGVDEIVITGVRRQGTGTRAEHFLHIYAVEPATGELARRCSTTYYEYDQLRTHSGDLWWRSNNSTTGIVLATGDLTPDDVCDEIVVAWNLFYGVWNYEGFPYYDWDYYHRNQTWIVSLAVDIDEGGQWSVLLEYGPDNISQNDRYLTESAGSPYDAWVTGTALGLAMADLDLDGCDEVVVSGGSRLRVYRASETQTLERIGSDIGIPYAWRDPSTRVLQAVNLDVVADSAQLNPEVVLLNRTSQSHNYRSIQVWRTVLDAEGRFASLAPAATLPQTDAPYAQSNTNYSLAGDAGICLADVDGDGIRLGPHKYYEINESSQAMVVLNTPPVHFDIVDGIPHDVSACYPQHDCDCFESAYSSEGVSGTTISLESHSDWGVGSSLSIEHGFLGAQIETSIEARFGQHFEKSGSKVETYTQTSHYSTGTWPRFKIMRSDQRIWEYPLYADDEFIDYFGVIRPINPTMESGWSSYTTWTGMDNPVTTDPGNIFSYRREVPTEDAWEVVDNWFDGYYEVGPAKDCDVEEMIWGEAEDNIETASWEAGGEVSASAGWGGVQVGVSGSYERGELSSVGSSVTEEISVAWSYGNLALGFESAAYRVKPFVYRSVNGALVLDYAAEPICTLGDGSFWDTHYGSHPDPSFTLPYRFYAYHGWDLEPRQFMSTDLRVSPNRPDLTAPGDTVQISAVVHNFSLVTMSEPVEVRFYVNDPDLERAVPITDITGQSVWEAGGLAQQETDTVRIYWEVQGDFPANPRIYAVIDGDTRMTEIHEDNNKAWVRFNSLGNGTSPVEDQVPWGGSQLQQNIPNPFNPVTRIVFHVPRTGPANLKIYDVAGRLVKTLLDEHLMAGLHERTWDGRSDGGSRVASGVYLYRLETPISTDVKRMVLLK